MLFRPFNFQEGLLNIEREERDTKERNTLELLTDVKKKWHDREEAKIQKLRKDIEAANVVVQVDLQSFYHFGCVFIPCFINILQ